MTIRGNRWFDHKRQQGGDTFGFLQEFMELSFQAVVGELLDGAPDIFTNNQLVHANKNENNQLPQKKPFILPPPSPNMHKFYAYLTPT